VDRRDAIRQFGIVAGAGAWLAIEPCVVAVVAWTSSDSWRPEIGRFHLSDGIRRR
jgi:hypothetical protein